MIYLDAIGISFLVEELKEIIGYRINKIYQYDNNSFSFIISKKELYFQIKDTESILYLKNKKSDNTQFKSNFLLSLRNKLENSIIKNIDILNDDRIVKIEFEKINILGNLEKYYIIFELMGRHSNIFLLDEKNKIINIFNNNVSIENKRFYSINSNYTLFDLEKEKLNFEKIYTSPEEMVNQIKGIGKIFANDSYNNIEKRKEIVDNKKVHIFTKDDNFYLTYSNFSKFKNYDKVEFNTLNEALNFYFEVYFNISIINDKKRKLKNFVLNKLKKNNKILSKIEEDKIKNKDYEKYKKYGDLLVSNLYSLKGKEEEIRVYDYENEKYINIKLDKNKTASENLRNYYKLYRKKRKAMEFSIERKNEIEDEIVYFNSVLNFVEMETEYVGLIEIEKELGILTEKRNKVKTKDKKRELHKYVINNFEVIVGRNNIENNYITFEIAKNYDIWLHVRDIPGSHVIIVTEKKKVDLDTIKTVAKLAAKHSKGKGRKIIDYTERVNVKRKNKLGSVTFNNFKSIEVII